MEPLEHSDLCPVAVVDASMDTFLGSLRIESQITDYIAFVVLFMAANAGGIPAPKDRAGKMFWAVWMLVAVFQWLATLFSLLMVCVAYFMLRQDYSACMTEFNHGMAMLDVVSFATFIFQVPGCSRVSFCCLLGCVLTCVAVGCSLSFSQNRW